MDVSDSFVIIKLENENSLKSKYSGAGLQKNGDIGSLTIESIDGSNDHSLRTEGNYGAGIGSVALKNANNITINSRTIKAIADAHCAGIGSGQEGSSSNITINGGYIIVIGGGDGSGCGIGAGGYGGADTNIHITGGYIEASGDWGMNGIGTDNSTGIEISGGTIVVKGEGNGKGIGGTPVITGGSIRLASDAKPGSQLMQNPPENVELKEIIIDKNTGLEGISFIDENINYCTKDVIADENGKLYLYLPEGAEIKSLTYKDIERFAVTFDERYDGKKNTLFMTELTESTKPNDPTRSYYTFGGWYTSADYKEDEKITDWDIDVNNAMTFYAKWLQNTFTFTEEKKEFTYGENVSWFNLSDLIQEEDSKSAGNKTFTITSGNLPEGLTLYNTYILGTPTSASPTEEGSTILLNITSNGNGYSLENQSLTIFIKKRDLTITPDGDQIIYNDEELTYQIEEGPLAGQTACFTGSLQVKNNVIVRGTLTLADGKTGNDFKASNYNLIITPDVPVIVNSQSLAEAVEAETLENLTSSNSDAISKSGWIKTHDNIMIIAPTGYKIQPNLDATVDNWEEPYTLTLDADGDIPVSFLIKNETSSKIYERSFDLKVDATAPVISDVTKSNLTFSIQLSDATSGIASYIWQLNDGTEETVTLSDFPQNSVFTHIGKDGDNTLLLSVTDQAGNIQTQTINFKLTVPKDPEPEDPDPVDPDEPDDPDPDDPPYVPEEPDEPDEPDVPEIPDEPDDPDVPTDPDEPSDPTANEDIDNDIHIGLTGSTLEIQISYPSSCWIIDYNGRIICHKQLAVGMNRIDNLPAGAYILYFEGKKGYRQQIASYSCYLVDISSND